LTFSHVFQKFLRKYPAVRWTF